MFQVKPEEMFIIYYHIQFYMPSYNCPPLTEWNGKANLDFAMLL